MSISGCFQSLIARIQPTGPEAAAKRTHASEIKACLKSAFAIGNLVLIGSYSRKSAVRGLSDLDLLAVFGRDEARRGGSYVASSTALDWVRGALSSRFRTTRSGRDGQAIVCQFADGDVDVVPAIFERMLDSRPCYRIPDSGGGWMLTAPDVHADFIKQAHAESGHKFTACVQLLKFWRDCRAARTSIGSFHMELVFAQERTFARVASYQECIVAAFRLLYERQCRAINDPKGISGRVAAAGTTAKVQMAVDHVAIALDKAERALAAERSRNQPEAQRYWNMVFNGHFPAS